jgi:hypothetical protein
MTLIHGVGSLWQLVLIGLWFFGVTAAAADHGDLERVLGEAVSTALAAARITVKEAAALMAMHESQLYKCLRADRGHHISLTRLVRLPFSFWMAFSPALLWLVAERNVREIAETVGLRKVS